VDGEDANVVGIFDDIVVPRECAAERLQVVIGQVVLRESLHARCAGGVLLPELRCRYLLDVADGGGAFLAAVFRGQVLGVLTGQDERPRVDVVEELGELVGCSLRPSGTSR
jgi:hypothetical protein